MFWDFALTFLITFGPLTLIVALASIFAEKVEITEQVPGFDPVTKRIPKSDPMKNGVFWYMALGCIAADAIIFFLGINECGLGILGGLIVFPATMHCGVQAIF